MKKAMREIKPYDNETASSKKECFLLRTSEADKSYVFSRVKENVLLHHSRATIANDRV